MWTVRLTRPSRADATYRTAYPSAHFLMPQCHRSVPWFTNAVYRPVSVDEATRTITAAFLRVEKDHMDRPRDPARLPA